MHLLAHPNVWDAHICIKSICPHFCFYLFFVFGKTILKNESSSSHSSKYKGSPRVKKVDNVCFRHARVSSTYPCLSVGPSVRPSVGHTFPFPICQRLWSLYVKIWWERTPLIFQFWVWVGFPEIGKCISWWCIFRKCIFRNCISLKYIFWKCIFRKCIFRKCIFWKFFFR